MFILCFLGKDALENNFLTFSKNKETSHFNTTHIFPHLEAIFWYYAIFKIIKALEKKKS